MDNKTKILCVAIAVLLASNGYLLYRLGNAEGKTEPVAGSNEEAKARDKPVFVTGHDDFSSDGANWHSHEGRSATGFRVDLRWANR
jgi:hypothetical protein